MSVLNIFKAKPKAKEPVVALKTVTVEEIHAEFDSAEERIQNEANKILEELKIPTETAVERKAKLAKELGFVNSSVVKEAHGIFARNKEIADKLHVTKKQASTLADYKIHYPKEKFLTVEELDRICDKYNLIYAPIVNYIKDIPEKNLLDIKTSRTLNDHHKEEDDETYTFKHDGSYKKETFNKVIKFLGKSEFTKQECNELLLKYRNNGTPTEYDRINLLWNLTSYCIEFKRLANIDDNFIADAVIKKTSKTGLFIAAPISHFDTKGLTETSTKGWFNVQTTEIKDPVVFQYCKDGWVRILTKWGTDDDQSYLDPALINETLN